MYRRTRGTRLARSRCPRSIRRWRGPGAEAGLGQVGTRLPVRADVGVISGLNSQEWRHEAAHEGLGNTAGSWASMSKRSKGDGRFGPAGLAKGRAKNQQDPCKVSSIRTVKRIFPAPLLLPSALLTQLPSWPGTHPHARRLNHPSRCSVQSVEGFSMGQGEAKPPGSSAVSIPGRTQPRAPGTSLPLAATRPPAAHEGNPRGCRSWLGTTGPASCFKFSPCL